MSRVNVIVIHHIFNLKLFLSTLVEYACRYILERKSSTTPFNTKATETNIIGIIVALTVLTLVILLVFLAGIQFYKCRRRHRLKNNGTGQEESKDLNMQATATATPTTVKERTSLLNKASNLFRELNQW